MLRSQFLKVFAGLPFFGAAGVVKAVESPVEIDRFEPEAEVFVIKSSWGGISFSCFEKRK